MLVCQTHLLQSPAVRLELITDIGASRSQCVSDSNVRSRPFFARLDIGWRNRRDHLPVEFELKVREVGAGKQSTMRLRGHENMPILIDYETAPSLRRAANSLRFVHHVNQCWMRIG